MDPKQIAKQIIAFNKAVFDNNFNAISSLHEQTGRFISKFMEKIPMLPEESRKVFSAWLKTCKNGCDNIKNNVDESFKKANDFYDK